MTLLEALLLGILQGITEFLPISSDGHLVLAEAFFGLQFETLKGFDVVLHAGTLLAMVIYFRADLLKLFTQNHRLLGYIVLATIPAVVAGLTLEDWIDATFRDIRMVLWMLLIMAAWYLIAEEVTRRKTKENSTVPTTDYRLQTTRSPFTLLNTFVIGLAQATALIQGISRSGSTIATGLLFGLKREAAARFSFLLGMPAIAGAVVLKSYHIAKGIEVLPQTSAVVVGFLASLISGYLAVAFLMKFLKTHTLRGFAVYLVLVGGVGLYLLSLSDPSELNIPGP